MSSTMKHYEATLNRNQSSLPNIEKPRLSSPIIDLDGIDKREEEIKNKEESCLAGGRQLEVIQDIKIEGQDEILKRASKSKVIIRDALKLDLSQVIDD
jgi:hypothetical protein